MDVQGQEGSTMSYVHGPARWLSGYKCFPHTNMTVCTQAQDPTVEGQGFLSQTYPSDLHMYTVVHVPTLSHTYNVQMQDQKSSLGMVF